MEISVQEEKGGQLWFWGAGTVAILFAIFLWSMDEMLTNSKREQILGETLYELRYSQTTLNSRVTDPRQVPAAEEAHQ